MPGAAKKGFMALMVGLMIGAILIAPLYTVTQDNLGTQTVTNETVAASTTDHVDLTGYDLVSGTTTVYAPNESTVASGDYNVTTASTDYDLNESTGSIRALSGGEIDDGEEILVTYDYAATGTTTALIVGFVPVLFVVAMVVVVGRWIEQNA